MAYTFSFSSIARTTQVRLLKGADIAHLDELDRKYWLMLSCAVTAMGPKGEPLARLLDKDGDGRVRVPEVLDAIAWLRPRLKDFDLLFVPAEGLSASDIAADTPEGTPLAQLFAKLSPEGILTAATVGEAFKTFTASVANGDGVVPPTVADEKFTPVGEAMIAVTGGKAAVDGSKGIGAETVEAFVAALDAYKAWKQAQVQCSFPEGLSPAAVTAAAVKLKSKIETFFLTGELVRYNPAAAATLPSPTSLADLANAPLALVNEANELPFADGINPNDRADMAVLETLAKALEPTATALTADLWKEIWTAVSPFVEWSNAKPAGADVFSGMDEQLFALAGEKAVHEVYLKAIAEDAAQTPLAAAFDDLNRLLIYRTGLLEFLRNFVNVEAFYPPKAAALFQTGTLYLDGRTCTLCLPIDKAPAAHATASKASNCCLVYCKVTRPSEKLTRTICAIFTAGSAATLAVGRNGLFYDLNGKDWEAEVVHLVANPMGLTEAFFAPWRKVADAFSAGIKKLVTSKNDAATAGWVAKAEKAATTPPTTKPEAAPAAGGGAMMASVATLGIALSFFATAVTGIVAALTSTPIWKTGLAVLGIILIVSVPSVLLTWFKLRTRDLAPILNASGWAINRRIGLTAGLGRFFTQRALYVGKKFVPAPQVVKVSPKAFLITTGIVLVLVGILAGWWWMRTHCTACEKDVCPATEVAPVAPEAPVPETPTTPAAVTPATPVTPAPEGK